MMRNIATAILLLVSGCAFGSDQFADGIYLRAEEGPAPEIVCQGGHKGFLGARQDLNILKVEFIPYNNSNTLFGLRLVVPFDESIKGGSFILLVAGTAYLQHMLGAPGMDAFREHMSGYNKDKSSLGFNVIGGDEAKEISEFFNAPLSLRTDPGYNLLATFTPIKPEFDPGEEVTAILRLKNAGTNTVAFQKGGRMYGRDTQFSFSAQYLGKPVEDIGADYGIGGGGSGTWMLEPGEVFEDTINLSKWFTFDRPGLYEVHGSYYLPFRDTDIFVCGTIWDDHVSADFSVKINTDVDLEQADAGTNLTIQVTGAVRKPMDIPYNNGMTVTKAIAAAGGFTGNTRTEVLLFRDKGGFMGLPSPYRVSEGDSKDSVLINNREITSGRAPDLQVKPGDLIEVRKNRLSGQRPAPNSPPQVDPLPSP